MKIQVISLGIMSIIWTVIGGLWAFFSDQTNERLHGLLMMGFGITWFYLAYWNRNK